MGRLIVRLQSDGFCMQEDKIDARLIEECSICEYLEYDSATELVQSGEIV